MGGGAADAAPVRRRERGAGATRVAVVLALLGGVAYLDQSFSALLPLSHLYYLPILLAALWFGYPGGIAAAGLAILLFHLTHFALTGEAVRLDEADGLRLALFLAVGLVTARLVEDRRRVARLAEDLEARNAELGRLNARLEELSQARADFVAVASHELRSPLASILGSAELLAKPAGADPDRRARLAAYIVDGTRRLRRTVENLLDAALIESGRFDLRREEVGLGDLLVECAQAFAGAGTERLVLPDPPPESTVWGDRDKLAQVLVNLVGNALKYSPEGSPVTIAVEGRPDETLVVVSDRGYGISPEDLPRVFERYYRADDGRVRAARGAGLGLSISREIARAHGGDLTVRSAPGLGSVFTLALPTGWGAPIASTGEGVGGAAVAPGATRRSQPAQSAAGEVGRDARSPVAGASSGPTRGAPTA